MVAPTNYLCISTSTYYEGTLRDVLSFGMNVSDEEIIEACKEVQLLDVIHRQQDGLDTVIGEGGLGLSGGERQRVA